MGTTSMVAPAVKATRSGGIGHQASARASWLIDPAPRLVGVATGSGPAGEKGEKAGESAGDTDDEPAGRPSPGVSVTSAQSSIPRGDLQSRSSVASGRGAAG